MHVTVVLPLQVREHLLLVVGQVWQRMRLLPQLLRAKLALGLHICIILLDSLAHGFGVAIVDLLLHGILDFLDLLAHILVLIYGVLKRI